MNLLKVLGGDFVSKVIDKVAPDKISQEDRMKINNAFELSIMDNKTKIESYARDIIMAEATSEDPFVSRARPFLFYVMYAVILFNYIIAPAFHLNTAVLPNELWGLFTAGYLGYSGLRTYDKHLKNKQDKSNVK